MILTKINYSLVLNSQIWAKLYCICTGRRGNDINQTTLQKNYLKEKDYATSENAKKTMKKS